jgi:hypothetical protein
MAARPDVFIVGAPRSGTTWVQKLLASHPEVISPPELHFYNYLWPAWNAWQRDIERLPDVGSGSRLLGWPAAISGAEFSRWLCATYHMVRSGVMAEAESSVFVEKTPINVLALDLLEEVSPGHLILHVVRDPRDVVASVLSASSVPWGSVWAPNTVEGAATLYRERVTAARASAERLQHRYLEVRYEDLHQDSEFTFSRLLSWIGVEPSVPPFDPMSLTVRGEAALRGVVAEEPEGFGSGARSVAGSGLSRPQLALTERLLRDYIEEWGAPKASPMSRALLSVSYGPLRMIRHMKKALVAG